MHHGVNPIVRKKHHLSTRTFGADTPNYQPFSLDAGFGFPDQNADGWPEECTIYTQTELCQDEDKQQYDRTFTRAQTDFISGQSAGPYDVEDSIEAVCVYGVAKAGETAAQAAVRKRGYAFWLEKMPGLDWFDSALALMQQRQAPLSVVSPWFSTFESAIGGLMPGQFPATWPPGVPGHNHKIYGLSDKAEQPVLMDKSWQGTRWGDNGVCYWTREAFNNLIDIPGSGAFILAEWDGSVTTIQWGIIYRLQILIALTRRTLGL